MQKTEHSVPLERLAGSMPFQGLRKPPALPGGLTHAQQSSLHKKDASKPAYVTIFRLVRACAVWYPFLRVKNG